MVTAELKTHLGIIRAFDKQYKDLDPTNESYHSVLAIADSFKGNTLVIGALKEAYNQAHSSELKAALCLALFKATSDLEWKRLLRRTAIDEVSLWMKSPSKTSLGSGKVLCVNR